MKFIQLFLLGLFFSLIKHDGAYAYTANRVWYEFHQNFIRVYVEYTIPELKEFREAYIELTNKKKADQFYFYLLKGAEFYIGQDYQIKFKQNRKEPKPW